MEIAPLVSIIIPNFNEPPEIIQESLASISSQEFRDFECIVVDESTDLICSQCCETFCARDPRFIYHKPKARLGLARSLNNALSMARGEWVARFDSDDICYPNRLSVQIEFLKKNKEVDVLGGGIEIIDDFGKTIAYRNYPLRHDQIQRIIHFTTPLAHPTVIYRRSTVLEAGGYDPSFKYAEDLDLWLRLINRGAIFANVNSTLVQYRQGSAIRNSKHWRYNLSARRKNFTMNHVLYRVTGIFLIKIWASFSENVQKQVFKFILFRNTPPNMGRLDEM